MAKNYTAYDAAVIIAEGIKKENALEYQDIMRRFPFFGALCTKLDATGLKLLEILPEYMTARKFNRYLKDNLGIDEVVEDDIDEVEPEEEEEKPKKAKKEKKAKKVVEEEEEEEKPKKRGRKPKKVEVEEEEDDDDDFDFDED